MIQMALLLHLDTFYPLHGTIVYISAFTVSMTIQFSPLNGTPLYPNSLFSYVCFLFYNITIFSDTLPFSENFDWIRQGFFDVQYVHINEKTFIY